MKKTVIIFSVAILFLINGFAQVPNAINFQAVARDASGNIMANTPIQIRLTILEGGTSGTPVYQELRAVTTNEYGSFAFQIGSNANYVTLGSFDDINWSTGNKYLSIDYDPTNQFNWNLTLGVIKFVTVPYAFTAGSVAYIDMTGIKNGDVLIYTPFHL
jgi:hypothetical protein